MTHEEEMRMADDGNPIVHMSDGHDLSQSDVADYKKAHPGVQVVNQQSPATGEAVTRKLTQGA